MRRSRAIGAPITELAGRAATGLEYDHGLLWVSGAATGKAFVYSTRSRSLVKEIQLAGSTETMLIDAELYDKYVVKPELAAILNALFSINAPENNRTDIVQALLQGIPMLNQHKGIDGPPAVDTIKLNLGVPPADTENRFGAISWKRLRRSGVKSFTCRTSTIGRTSSRPAGIRCC